MPAGVGVTAPPPMPRWFLLLPLCAALLWWPLFPYWKSDDYLALHYAQDLGRALHDFVGPQYGATDVWWFYRPLITLSFWVDQCVGGPSPFVSHLSNVLAHAVSTLLVALLWRRFLPDGRAFLAGLLWATMPAHQAAILWAVGRVDSHAAVWCLLTLWLSQRRHERLADHERAPRWPSLLAFAVALASKELAFVVPPLAAALVCLRLAGIGFAARLRLAAAQTAPLFGLLVVYFVFRYVVLGRLVGGYDDMQFDPVAMLDGLVQTTADLLVPMRWSGGDALAFGTGLPRGVWVWITALPVLVAAAAAVRHARRLIALPLFLLACLPMAAFFASAHNVHNLRYYYLPAAALVGLLAAPGRLVAVLVLGSWLLPLAFVRGEVLAADRQSREIHEALQRAADEGATEPMFVAGLPHANANGHSLQFHFGVDRVLQPPFRDRGVRLFALRPIIETPGVFRLDAPGSPPTSLPLGSTWWWHDSAGLQSTTTVTTLPDLTIQGDDGGIVDLTTPRLEAMQSHARPITLHTGTARPAVHRLTIFTATGYFCCLFPDHGPADAAHGTIDLRRFFVGHPDPPAPQQIPPAVFAPGQYVMLGLQIPTTHDLSPEFPVLIESGDLVGGQFVGSHRAARMLTFRFDRGYPRWVRRALGLER